MGKVTRLEVQDLGELKCLFLDSLSSKVKKNNDLSRDCPRL